MNYNSELEREREKKERNNCQSINFRTKLRNKMPS